MTVHAVHSTKFDGGMHYSFPLEERFREDGLLIAFMEPGRPLRSYRGDGLTRFNSLHYYWSDRHYNVTVMWESDWSPHAVYVNIATPATWDGGVVRFVDLDLDVMWRAGATAPHVEDKDEYECHRVKWSYPADLVASTWRAVDQVRYFFEQGWTPFNPAMLAWRPPEPPPLPAVQVVGCSQPITPPDPCRARNSRPSSSSKCR